MKPTILTEGRDDIAILRALLPPDLMAACELRPTEGKSTLVSVAHTHLIKHQAPIAVLLDMDTLDSTVIAETVQTTKYLIGAVAGGTPFEIIYCIPHIEVIFFDSDIDFQRLFPNFKNVFLLPFARTQPKQQLQVLLKEGGGPGKLSDFLKQLTLEEVKKLQKSYPILQLSTFLRSNLSPDLHN